MCDDIKDLVDHLAKLWTKWRDECEDDDDQEV